MQNNHFNLTTRAKVTLVAGAVFVVAVFSYLITHYAPVQNQATSETVAIDSHANGDLIRSITEEPKKDEPVDLGVIHEAQGDGEDFSEPPIHQEVQQRDVIQEKQDSAAQSPISVYSGEGQTISPDHQNVPAVENSQGQKDRGFLESASDPVKTHINDLPHSPHTPYEIKGGTLIPAILETSLNSSLPGKIIAKVSQNVYDTVTGNYLLVPQGTTLLGTYDAQVAYGQDRALVVWQRMIFPNGSSMQLEGQPGVDLAGHAGLHDKVNNHYMRTYGSAVMFSLLTAAGQLSQPKKSGDAISSQELIYASIGQQVAQVNAQAIAKNLAIQPTIEIRSGTHFNVMLGQDLILNDVYHFQEQQ